MKNICFALLLGLVGLSRGLAQGTAQYLPEGTLQGGISIDGNRESEYPLSSNLRYQQVYAASSFVLPDGADGFLIRSMYFRLDAPAGGSIGNYVTNFSVSMSTTPRQPDSLSPVYDLNHGPNQRQVYGPATTFFGSHWEGPNGVQTWDIGVLFPEPFLYRPGEGNLLIDIRTGRSPIFTYLDAWDRGNDSVSSVFGPVGELSGTLSTVGLSTRFTGQLVPEPSTYALLGLGLASFALLARKKRGKVTRPGQVPGARTPCC